MPPSLTARADEAHPHVLAVATLDPELSDVLSKIRKDFNAAGVVQSDGAAKEATTTIPVFAVVEDSVRLVGPLAGLFCEIGRR